MYQMVEWLGQQICPEMQDLVAEKITCIAIIILYENLLIVPYDVTQGINA